MQRDPRILIVGAGIGGLTFAAALKRRGCSAEIVERNPTLNALGAGLAVQPNALRVLHQLGIGDDTCERALGSDTGISATRQA